MVLAGEESGDLHGAAVVRALRARHPDLTFWGLGGERLSTAGVECVAGLDELAVMGFAEVLGRLRFFRHLERQVRERIAAGKVRLVLAIDYPGFNLRVARFARERGVPVLYYIAPQVWAWKARRAARLARDATAIAVILPFEKEIFEREGAWVEFVGHPLLDLRGDHPDRKRFCTREGLHPAHPILALFPGSRAQEVGRLLGPFLAAAEQLRATNPTLQVALARAPALRLPELPPWAHTVTDAPTLLRHARAGIVKSGTSTLEAAIAGMPFVCAYKTHPLTFAVAKRVVRVPHVALANLVGGERVVPELLQGDATPAALARAVAPLLTESQERTRMLEGFTAIRSRLGSPGAAERVADLAVQVLTGATRPG